MAISAQTDRRVIKIAREVIETEIESLKNLKLKGINSSFVRLINLIISSKGKIVLSGVGKSGIIAQKISSTLTSTKTPSIFIHPTEAMHGDIGIISSEDILILLSNSGETIEVNKFASICSKRNVKIVSITNNPKSKLASISDISIIINYKKEACPYNIVPTSSAISMLALGDAMAITLMKAKKITQKDFAINHPGGNIGKLFYLKVREIMRSGERNPVININSKVKDAISEMTRASLGAVSIVDNDYKLRGYLSDGDLRRNFSKISISDSISIHMTKNPIRINENEMAIEAARIIETRKIDNIPVVDKNNRVVGIIDERDLLREGII